MIRFLDNSSRDIQDLFVKVKKQN